MPRTGPTNPVTRKIIEEMSSVGYKIKSNFMIAIAEDLQKPTRSRIEVNVARLERVCKANETVAVPGKVLSFGILTKPLTVSALAFSKEAESKIKKAGGKTITLLELVKTNPKGTKVRLIK
ncbi:MAG: 50S ribosomal protein L18e [Candidatus Aenigmarchaeota archaeon]|nr:50S ribosomal protein L18e [Candidatus Aenigmarchaeota archaeon]